LGVVWFFSPTWGVGGPRFSRGGPPANQTNQRGTSLSGNFPLFGQTGGARGVFFSPKRPKGPLFLVPPNPPTTPKNGPPGLPPHPPTLTSRFSPPLPLPLWVNRLMPPPLPLKFVGISLRWGLVCSPFPFHHFPPRVFQLLVVCCSTPFFFLKKFWRGRKHRGGFFVFFPFFFLGFFQNFFFFLFVMGGGALGFFLLSLVGKPPQPHPTKPTKNPNPFFGFLNKKPPTQKKKKENNPNTKPPPFVCLCGFFFPKKTLFSVVLLGFFFVIWTRGEPGVVFGGAPLLPVGNNFFWGFFFLSLHMGGLGFGGWSFFLGGRFWLDFFKHFFFFFPLVGLGTLCFFFFLPPHTPRFWGGVLFLPRFFFGGGVLALGGTKVGFWAPPYLVLGGFLFFPSPLGLQGPTRPKSATPPKSDLSWFFKLVFFFQGVWLFWKTFVLSFFFF